VILNIVCLLLQLYALVLVVYAVMSWFPIGSSGAARSFADLLWQLVSPVVTPIRARMRPVMLGGVALDLSITIPLLVIWILLRVLCGS
jgi:uncharacterized protein YggT (Ycf19 family)